MTNKVQKIRKRIEKLKSQLSRGACSSQVAMETRCKEEAYNEVLAILDTMQEEHVKESEEIQHEDKSCEDNGNSLTQEPTSWLDELSAKLDSLSKEEFEQLWGKYGAEEKEELVSDDLEEEIDNYIKRNGYDGLDSIEEVKYIANHFIKWQKEQMMMDAIDGKIYETQARSKLKAVTTGNLSRLDYKVGDKVKVIVIKKDRTMSKVMEGISEQIVCPHWFRVHGIEGCTAGRSLPCNECNHPDKRIEKVKWSSISTED